MVEIGGQVGEWVKDAAQRAVDTAGFFGETVKLTFNDAVVYVRSSDTVDEVVKRWEEETERKRAEFWASPAGLKAMAERVERERKAIEKEARVRAQVGDRVFAMTDEQRAKWDEIVKVNDDDGYGRAGVEYTRIWGVLMDDALAEGKALADVWDELSHEADIDGITGFMYGWATGCLARVWVHGEELRRLHNRKNSPRGAELDDKPGATINPAILTIGS